MKYSQLVRVQAELIRRRETFLTVGPPGGGKTASWYESCKLALARLILTHPIVYEEVDYRGLPGFERAEDGELTAVFKPFGFLRELTRTRELTFVGLDDMGQARQGVQAASMHLVHAKEIDGVKVSETVTFGMASNRREDRAAVTGFVSALLDRCVTVLQLDFDADELARYLIGRDYDPLLAAFIRFTPTSVEFDSKDDFVKCATPRSIEGLGRLLRYGLDAHEVVQGAVGPSFASKFLAYRKVESKLPTVESIMKAPKRAPVPDDREVLYALMACLAGKLDEKNLEPGITYLDRVPPEFAVMVLKDVAAKIPNLQDVPAFAAWAHEHAKLLGV